MLFSYQKILSLSCLAAGWIKVSRNLHTSPNQQSRGREKKEERKERSTGLSSLLFPLTSLPPPSAPALLSARLHSSHRGRRTELMTKQRTGAFFFMVSSHLPLLRLRLELTTATTTTTTTTSKTSLVFFRRAMVAPVRCFAISSVLRPRCDE